MEAFWGMFGVIVGGIITWFVQWDGSRRGRAEQERAAAMQIASQLRFWLTETMHVLGEHEVHEASNPSDDPNDVHMPFVTAFPFETSLDSISHLPSQIAQDVFGLIERKMSVEKEASFVSFVSDNQDAAEIFDARLAGIWVDGTTIYANLAKLAGWTEPAATEQEIASMRKNAAKLEEIRNKPSGIDLGDS
jgi:hypothetical protein